MHLLVVVHVQVLRYYILSAHLIDAAVLEASGFVLEDLLDVLVDLPALLTLRGLTALLDLGRLRERAAVDVAHVDYLLVVLVAVALLVDDDQLLLTRLLLSPELLVLLQVVVLLLLIL